MIDQINLISQGWWSWMFDMFWQASLVVVIVSAIDLLIRKWAWPQVRYALWTLVLLKLILPPTWAFSGSIIPNIYMMVDNKIVEAKMNQDFSDESGTLVPVKSNETSELSKENKIEPVPIIGKDESSLAAVESSISWKSYLMGFWLTGILIFGIILLKRLSKIKKWHLEQKSKKNIPVWFHELLVKVAKQLSIERLPSIVFSDQAISPAVYGVFRPVFLLPEKYVDTLTKEEAEHVLLHELAHVKRGDLVVHGICLFLQVIYWFNPFIIWARKQMKHVREICCDLTIANILREKTVRYRQTLINTARELLTESVEPGMGLLGLFEEPFRLVSRLKWLEKKSWENRRSSFVVTILVALLFTAFVMPMGNIENQYVVLNHNSIEGDELDNYRDRINSLNEEVNQALIDWDFEIIEKYYTDDVILSQESRPTLKGKKAILEDFRKLKYSGFRFNSLDETIYKIWKEGKQIYVVDTHNYSISLTNIDLDLSGAGKSLTIWEIQDDESLKIKYSILNVDSMFPTKLN